MLPTSTFILSPCAAMSGNAERTIAGRRYLISRTSSMRIPTPALPRCPYPSPALGKRGVPCVRREPDHRDEVPDRDAPGRPVRGRGGAWLGRDGRRVSRPRPAAWTSRRGEGVAPPTRRGSEVPGPVPARGPSGGFGARPADR